MKNLSLRIAAIMFAIGAVIVGATGAFYNDIETSSDNEFTAGEINLKIDNHSYYNGVLNASTTWDLVDLTVEKFFDFPNLTPGDYGEDTISLHVDTNDAYMCANIKLTSNDDNDPTDPELLADSNTGPGLGELALLVNFIWWADDGDNVLEDDENIISQGAIGSITVGDDMFIPLADSNSNAWTGIGGPVPGGETLYLGKAWCFGVITAAPLAQDGVNNLITPANTTGGIHCNGSTVDNAAQTDSLTADLEFIAVQSRNNPGYVCGDFTSTGELTIFKVIVNNNGGNNVISDFKPFVDNGGSVSQLAEFGQVLTLPVGTYDVSEVSTGQTTLLGYTASFTGDCDSSGVVDIQEGDQKICTITNTEKPAYIHLTKNVDGDPNSPLAGSFSLSIDGNSVTNGSLTNVTSNTPHSINEAGLPGYHFVSITGDPQCPSVLGGTLTLTEGQSINCTINNDHD